MFDVNKIEVTVARANPFRVSRSGAGATQGLQPPAGSAIDQPRRLSEGINGQQPDRYRPDLAAHRRDAVSESDLPHLRTEDHPAKHCKAVEKRFPRRVVIGEVLMQVQNCRLAIVIRK